MIVCNDSICPNCGGDLKYYNTVQRIIKTKGGEINWINTRQFICTKCNAIHRELPDCLIPYKHYDSRIIKAVLNETIASDDPDYNYPCSATVNRWKKSQEIQLLLRSKQIASERRQNVMKGKETKICPYCGGISKSYGYAERTVRSEYGKVERIRIKQFRCKDCGKKRRDLPDYLMPYKQFKTEIVEGFVNGDLSVEDLKYEDFPCEQTIKRWKKEKNKK